MPCQKLKYSDEQPNRTAYRGYSHVEIQRGVGRTNCIDSLDRTNFAQEMIGYQTCLLQLQKLGLSDTAIILSLQSDLFKEIVDMYNEMGDTISMQYGGSIAHHS